MKKLFMILAAGALFLSCGDDPAGEVSPVSEISVSPETPALIDYAGGTVQVTVTSSGEWRLAGKKTWCHPSATAGKSGDKVIFTVDPNPTDEERTLEYKFFSGDKTLAFAVKQRANEVFAITSADNFEVGTAASNVYVQVSANIEYSVRIEADAEGWITQVETEEDTRAAKTDYLVFAVAENKDYSGRTGHIAIEAAGVAYPVCVVQKQVDALIVEGPASYEFDLEAHTLRVEVRANVPLKVTTPAWIVYKEGPETQSLEPRTLTFELERADKTRSGEINIANAENIFMYSKIAVHQRNPDAVIVTIPDKNFRNYLKSKNLATPMDGDQMELQPAAKTVTSMSLSYRNIETLEGIEYFPNLTKLELNKNRLSRLDISKLTKVSSLTLNGQGIEEVILGDNPVESLSMPELSHNDENWMPHPSENMVVTGSKLKKLTLAPSPSWDDELVTLDVSGCPALETLNCARSSMKLTTLYLAAGQQIPDLTKNDNTQIVYK